MFYLGLPLLIWNFGRGILGAYQAMFMSAFIGIAYTAFKFFHEKKYNITGIVIILGISIYLFLTIISDSAIGILYNSLILNGILSGLYIFSILIRRPLGKYFYIDYRRMFGEDQKISALRAKQFEERIYFDYLTILLAVRELMILVIKWVLLNRLGIEGASIVILVNRILSYTFIGLIAMLTIEINQRWYVMIDHEKR
jgi:hypothetical protein